MKMTIVVPILGQLQDTKAVYPSWISSIGCEADLLVIDNAPNCGDNTREFLANFVMPRWPGKVLYAPQEDNLGVIKSMQFAYEVVDSDILAFLHNDLFVYGRDWGCQVLDHFRDYPQTGLVGFFGAEGVSPDSGRFNVWNNMLEAEIHGWRFQEGVREVAVLDGLCMIANKQMLAVRGGLDLEYDVHHFYDLDLSLESLDRGFRNYVLPVYCHHQSGVTACRPLFQEWANKYVGVEEKGENQLYFKNRDRFTSKWGHRLPYSVKTGWRS